jgi:hypothetical protein
MIYLNDYYNKKIRREPLLHFCLQEVPPSTREEPKQQQGTRHPWRVSKAVSLFFLKNLVVFL